MFLMSLLFAYQNLGDYLSLRWSDCFKQFVLESNENRGKIAKKRDSNNNQTAACCGSRWQKIPVDIMDKTLQHLNLSDRIRLGCVCKFWNSIALRRDIRGAPDQLPWLVLPQARNSNYLRFSSLSEGKVVELKLPKPAHGGQFLSSSKGWLVMAREKGLNSDMFLLNPISGRQHQLPYLREIPSFQTFVTTPEWKYLGVRPFFRKIVLSSANVSECVVAVVFSSLKELGLCKPGDKSWSVFQVIQKDKDSIIQDILFSCTGKLYASVDGPSNIYNDGVVAARTLNFGDDEDCAVELKLVVFDSYKYLSHEINEIGLKAPCLPCLLETPNNQVLFVHAMCDVVHNVQNYLEGRPYHIRYFRTREIRVYKIDSESGNFIRVDNLGNQILFVAEHGSCLSLPASDFKELQGNCIYFAALGIQDLYSRSHIRPVSREIGIFYLDDGKIVRPFPSVEAYSYSIPTLPYAFVETYSIRTRWQISWYSPSLW